MPSGLRNLRGDVRNLDRRQNLSCKLTGQLIRIQFPVCSTTVAHREHGAVAEEERQTHLLLVIATTRFGIWLDEGRPTLVETTDGHLRLIETTLVDGTVAHSAID